jgi:hypothetical protein
MRKAFLKKGKNMIWNNLHVIEQEIMNDQKKVAEEINFPNMFKQLQDEWAEKISEEAEEKKLIKSEANKKKLSPGVLKKLKEYRSL